MVKLVSVFNTKYFHAVFGPRIAKYFQEHPNETIDLAGAKLTADCTRVVISAISDQLVKFIDSEDSERNRTLQHDQEVRALRDTLPPVTYLPSPLDLKHMEKLLTDDYTGKLVEPRVLKGYDALWIVMFIAKRPDVKVHMPTNLCTEIFKTINTYYDRRLYVGKPVYYVREGGFGVDVNENPTLEFCNSNYCVPTEFGSVDLYKSPDWEIPLKGVCSDLVRSLGHYGRTIKDVLRGG